LSTLKTSTDHVAACSLLFLSKGRSHIQHFSKVIIRSRDDVTFSRVYSTEVTDSSLAISQDEPVEVKEIYKLLPLKLFLMIKNVKKYKLEKNYLVRFLFSIFPLNVEKLNLRFSVISII
jgi:hypothetical protein